MLITSTLHNHCTLCDGKSTLDEMVMAAINAGFTDFGMSCHGYMPFEPKYSMPGETEYIEIMDNAKKKYASDIRVWTGVEEDMFAPSKMRDRYDYIIGDVHYAREKHTGELIPIDGSATHFANACNRMYKGKPMELVKEYYENMVKAASEKPDILGHFDLVVKNNSGNRFFDEESDEYIDIAEAALKACNEYGIIFEVNTGAVVKGKRKLPYPSVYLLKILREAGGRVTLSADCHNARLITGELELGLNVIRQAGFRHIHIWENGKFVLKEI